MYTVYELVSKKDGETYIGCTSQNLKSRAKQHKSRLKNEYKPWPLYQYMRNHGFDAMEIKAIRRFGDKEQALAFEAKMIRQKGTLNQYKVK